MSLVSSRSTKRADSSAVMAEKEEARIKAQHQAEIEIKKKVAAQEQLIE